MYIHIYINDAIKIVLRTCSHFVSGKLIFLHLPKMPKQEVFYMFSNSNI